MKVKEGRRKTIQIAGETQEIENIQQIGLTELLDDSLNKINKIHKMVGLNNEKERINHTGMRNIRHCFRLQKLKIL